MLSALVTITLAAGMRHLYALASDISRDLWADSLDELRAVTEAVRETMLEERRTS